MLALLLSLILAAPAPEPLATIATRRTAAGADGHWRDLVQVYRDGTWRAGPRTGRLDDAELDVLKARIDLLDPRADGPSEQCAARPFNFTRLTVTRRAERLSFEESGPCGVRFAAVAKDVVGAVQALTSPPLYVLALAPMDSEQWAPITTVRADGSWVRRQGGSGPATVGKLEPAELTTLVGLLAQVNLTLQTTGRPVCAARPLVRHSVTANGGTLTWEAPCSTPPHPSVRALIDHVGQLTVSPAPLVTLATAVGVQPSTWTDNVTVLEDGTVVAGERESRLTAAELATLRAALDALDVDEVGERKPCRARPVRHTRLRIFRPQHILDFEQSLPCGRELTPAAKAVADRLVALARP